ncbi:hypothetical protein [Terribacillus saccharophilus]|uniref:hypothetical protein n=1 Tax=Terribacillus saccharophilus TaxID=361277 RepID=UPI002989ED7E|nr:hypothetical protein [Terribacillus saccharophilus]MCM3227514.1 hypothetical protein [Terribacillus saccharophilus]
MCHTFDRRFNKLINETWLESRSTYEQNVMKLEQEQLNKLAFAIIKKVALFLKSSSNNVDYIANYSWNGMSQDGEKRFKVKDFHRTVLWYLGDSIHNLPEYISERKTDFLRREIVSYYILVDVLETLSQEILETDFVNYYKRLHVNFI